MSGSNTEVKRATAKWQKEVNERIDRKIRLLQEEFEEVLLLKHFADQVRRFRKRLAQRYD